MNVLSGLLSAFGLSTAAGLNAYIPLLVIGLLGRYSPNLIQLSAPFDVLTNPWVLIGVGVVAILDFIGDKIPVVDHGLHVAGLIVSPIAGAIAFMAANSAAGSVDPTLAAICGLLVAGGMHVARTTARPVATATTAGVANPVLSFVEDVSSLLLSLLAVVLPLLAFVLAVALVLLIVFGLRRLLRRRDNPRRLAR